MNWTGKALTKTSQELAYALRSIANSPATIPELSIRLEALKETLAVMAEERTDWNLLDQSLSARSRLLKVTITLRNLVGEPDDVCDEDVAKLRASLPRLQEKGVVEVRKYSEVSISSNWK